MFCSFTMLIICRLFPLIMDTPVKAEMRIRTAALTVDQVCRALYHFGGYGDIGETEADSPTIMGNRRFAYIVRNPYSPLVTMAELQTSDQGVLVHLLEPLPNGKSLRAFNPKDTIDCTVEYVRD
jgi:hypothetical protein